MRIVFMGTPEFAVPVLRQAVESGHEVVGVYTQPDKPVGRKQILTMSPVKQYALEQGLMVYQPRRIKRPQAVEELRQLQPELILVAAYGQILSEEILRMARFGCINMHASLLPRYRGASPIQRCIMNGDGISGVTAMQMDIGIDTGDMLMKQEVPVLDEDTAEDLRDRLAEAARVLTVRILDLLSSGGELHPIPQNDQEATMAPMLSKEDGRIDWTRDARTIYNQIRGLTPWPSAYTFWNEKKLTIWKARVSGETAEAYRPGEVITRKKQLFVATGSGLLEIVSLQLQGKKQMAADAFLLGNHPEGSIFG